MIPREFFFRERQVGYLGSFSLCGRAVGAAAIALSNCSGATEAGNRLAARAEGYGSGCAKLQCHYPENAQLGANVVPMQVDYAGDARSGLGCCRSLRYFPANRLFESGEPAARAVDRAPPRNCGAGSAGCDRVEIAAQLLTESLLLSLGGGALGLMLGKVCWNVFGALVPAQVGSQGFQIDGQVLVFNAAISIAAGVLFGFAPAFRAADATLHDALKQGERTCESRGGLRLRDALVVAQFALAFALLVGSGLMIQTIWNLHKEDLGFPADHLLTMGISLPKTKYDTDEKTRVFFSEVEEKVRALPGIKSAGFSSEAPFMTEGDTRAYVVEGELPLPKGHFNDALYREVTPGYLEAIGANLREGRVLEGPDRAGGLNVVVVNDFLAKRHFPGLSALGKRVRFGNNEDDTKNPWWMIVGVVRDIRERGLLIDMKPTIYVPVTQVQDPQRYSNLVLRTSNDPESSTKATESAVWSVDSQQPVMDIRTMDQLIKENLADRMRPMILLGVFAGLALVLACLGVYGVLAYGVAQRTREIGVRMALGAKPSNVTWMVLRRGLGLSCLGLLAGAVLAFALSSLLRSLLFGVTAIAPPIYLSTALVLLFVALAACVIPAQRASRVDPVLALRGE